LSLIAAKTAWSNIGMFAICGVHVSGAEGRSLVDRLDRQASFTDFDFHIPADREAGVSQPAAAQA
jgi:hypothetical protein